MSSNKSFYARAATLTITLVASAVLPCWSRGTLLAQPSPQPRYLGKLVDVGGYRVHLNCTGTGQPTVLILGAGYSFDWSLVQGPTSALTRVCTYDPAGSVWSDPGPTPTCDGRVLEIHHMVQKGGIDGPLVLVGHSIGAVFARLYAARFPAEVRGVVISDHAGGYRISAPPATPFGGPATIPSEEQAVANLPPAAQALHRWAASLPHASSIPFYNECMAQLDTSKANRAKALGSRPLVVIANALLAGSEDYLKVQSRLLALSSDARAMTAATNGHGAPLEDPGVIVRSITWVVDELRKR